MTWVAVAAGAAAVIGAGASYAGSKKQSDAAKKGANLQMQQFQTLNQQQQPFIQSGYGAMGKLNTLLGIGGMPSGGGSDAPMGGGGYENGYAPRPNGAIDQRIPSPQQGGGDSNIRLKQILALRAQNGDTEAARMLGQV